MSMDNIINKLKCGVITMPQAIEQLEASDVQCHGYFEFKGYDYINQRWVDAQIPPNENPIQLMRGVL